MVSVVGAVFITRRRFSALVACFAGVLIERYRANVMEGKDLLQDRSIYAILVRVLCYRTRRDVPGVAVRYGVLEVRLFPDGVKITGAS